MKRIYHATQARRVGGWSEAEGPKDNTACGHRADHEKKRLTSKSTDLSVILLVHMPVSDYLSPSDSSTALK